MGSWGGGYWPIVPTDGATISEDYWQLLSLTDPDIITAAVSLTEALQRDLRRRIAPSQLDVRPVSPDDTHPLVRTDWPMSALASAGVLRYHHDQAHLFSSDAPLLWFREQHTQPAPPSPGMFRARPEYPGRRFVQRNFGYPRVSWLLEHELKTLPYREVSLVGLSASMALHELAGVRCMPYRSLSRLHAPKPFSPGHVGSPAYTIVVGDSVSDAVRAWNRSVVSHPVGQVLWVPEVLASDDEFLDALRSWAERTWAGSSGGPSGVNVESASVEPDRLNQLAEAVNGVQRTTVSAFDPETLPFSGTPSAGVDYTIGSRRLQLTAEVSAVIVGGEATAVTVVPPVVLPSEAQGGWMVDLDIVDDTSPARFDNLSPRWRLPRRADLVRPFLPTGSVFPRMYRVMSTGLPSVSATVDVRTVTLRRPSHQAVANALVSARRPDNGQAVGYATGDAAISEQGQGFRSVVELFGSVYRAGQYLCTSFWRDQILLAAGNPVASREEQTAIVHRLLTERGDLTDAQLAARIASKVHRTQRRSGDSVTKERLKGAYHQAIRQTYADAPKNQRPTFADEGWPDFERLIERGVFLQGSDLRCPSCGLARWHPVDALGRTVQCPECLRPFTLPADPGWSYRLNGLVQSALADDAVLPVIDAAYAISTEARTHALILPPMDIYDDSGAQPLTDLDLFALRDGQLVVGEVKSSAGGFTVKQLLALSRVAAAIQADEVVLAAPAATWAPEIEAEMSGAVQEEVGPSVTVRVLHLKPDLL